MFVNELNPKVTFLILLHELNAAVLADIQAGKETSVNLEYPPLNAEAWIDVQFGKFK